LQDLAIKDSGIKDQVTILKNTKLLSCCFSAILSLFLASSTVAALARTDLQASAFAEDKDGENALDLEDYARAEATYRSDLSKKLGAAQEGYIRTGLGESLLWQGRFNEAGKELKRAYSLVDKTQPQASDLRARVLDAQSWLDETRKDRSSAIANCKAALDCLNNVKDADPPHRSAVLEHLGYLMRESGQYLEAARYYGEALEIKGKTYGADSLQAADVLEQVSMMLRRLGKNDEAAKQYMVALQIKSRSPALFTAFSPHVYSDTVTYRFCPGTPNCALTSQNGETRQAVNIGGLTVGVSMVPATKELAKSTRVNVTVLNQSPYPVQLLSKPPVLTVMEPKVALSHLVDPTALADKIEKKGDKSAKWVRFWGADSTMPVTTTFIGHPGVWGYTPVTTYNNIPPAVTTSGNVTTVTTRVPDYVAQMRALQKAADIQERSREQASTIRESSLGATTIQPGGTTSGTLYFDTTSVQKAILQLPVGNGEFEFQFPPDN